MANSNAMPKRRVVSGSNLSPSKYCLIGIRNPAHGNGEAGQPRTWRPPIRCALLNSPGCPPLRRGFSSCLPPRRQQPFSRLGDPHTRRLDSPIFVLEAFVPCDDQTALYQLN
jgi:hypothetical protein